MSSISPARVVYLARKEIGTRERGSNRTAYGKAYGLDGVAWCGIFVWSVFSRAGIDLRREGITAAASTNLFDQQARRAGWQRVTKTAARPGDVVFYDFGDLDGRGPDTANDNDHVGIVSRRAISGNLKAVEGNTASGSYGSQANGDGVFERTRSLAVVRHVYRPPYKAFDVAIRARQKAAAAALKAAAARKAAIAKAAKARAQAAAKAKKATADKKKTPAVVKVGAGVVAIVVGGGAVAAVNEASKPAPKPTPTVTASPTPTRTTHAPPTTSPPVSKPVLTRTLVVRRPVMRGPDVAAVRRLIGVRVGTLYTPKTADAVKVWQKAHGLKPDGSFGPAAAKAAGWKVAP